jgi:cell division protein FtsW (lipid II flippase)
MAITMWMSINKMEDSPLMGLPILVSVALPFYVGFALDPKRWGILIPAIIGTVVMILILISDTNLEDVGVMFVFALPFFVIYLLSKKNWWAFIPAGTFASFGLISILEILVPHEEYTPLPNTLSWYVFI